MQPARFALPMVPWYRAIERTGARRRRMEARRETHVAGSKRPSFLKRQKEQQRLARAAEKREARRARKLAKATAAAKPETPEAAEPQPAEPQEAEDAGL